MSIRRISYKLIAILIITIQISCMSSLARTDSEPTNPPTIVPIESGNAELTLSSPTVLPTMSPIARMSLTPASAVKLNEWFIPYPRLLDINWAPIGEKFIVLTREDAEMYDAISAKRLWIQNPVAPSYAASNAIFSRDGKSLALYSRLGGLQLLDPSTGQILADRKENNNPGNCLQADAYGSVLGIDGHTIFIILEDPRSAQSSTQIVAWDLISLKCSAVFANLEGFPYRIHTNFDGSLLAVSVIKNLNITQANEISETGQTTIFDIETKEQICSVPSGLVMFKPESNSLYVLDSSTFRLNLWDAENCQMIGSIANLSSPYYYLAMGNNGQEMALGNGKNIQILDANSGLPFFEINDLSQQNIVDPLRVLDGRLIYSPNDKYLLSIIPNGTGTSIILWTLMGN